LGKELGFTFEGEEDNVIKKIGLLEVRDTSLFINEDN